MAPAGAQAARHNSQSIVEERFYGEVCGGVDGAGGNKLMSNAQSKVKVQHMGKCLLTLWGQGLPVADEP